MAYRVPLFSALLATVAVFASAMLLSIRRQCRAATGQVLLFWDSKIGFALVAICLSVVPVALAIFTLFYLRW
jgi:hypothetical protein